jgi:hypothetical protein
MIVPMDDFAKADFASERLRERECIERQQQFVVFV